MKKPVILIALFSILFGSCRDNRDDTSLSPNNSLTNLLHQRWQFSQTRRANDTTWAAPYRNFIDDKEFQPDGTIVYRHNGVLTTTPCCQPTRYSLTGQTINYSDWNLCPLAFCGLVKNERITQLSENLLETSSDNIVTQYTPVK